ncbi:SHOCT domain-containing protein [Enterococcus rotai]|uniref:SHOCT domain-containing protein n=1 Tax=Enterococcus rotai TaxID=118060 RepID=UPI0032B50A94
MGLFRSKEEKAQQKAEQKAKQDLVMERAKTFKSSKSVDDLLFIDTGKNLFRLSGLMNMAKIYSFDQVTGYEVVEDGNTLTSGGLGRAAVGAMTFGPAGAIIGAITGKKKSQNIIENLKIKINLVGDPSVIYIDLITKKTKSSSSAYKNAVAKADRIISTLDSFARQTNNNDTSSVSDDDILKFKKYLDEGIITQEEFNAKKKELLNL